MPWPSATTSGTESGCCINAAATESWTPSTASRTRSFQEYLAAAYLRREEPRMFERFPEADCDEWPELAAHLGRGDPDRWREVVLLAGGIKAAKEPGPVWRLVDALTPDQDAAEPLIPEDAWGLRLAGEILAG